MEGLRILRDGEAISSTPDIKLLMREGSIDIMQQEIVEGSVVWLTPSEDPSLCEFFYVLCGEFILKLPEGQERLVPGDCFYLKNLHEGIPAESIGNVKLLYVVSNPLYNYLSDFSSDLHTLLAEIEEKDNYTYRHSRAVAKYSLRIAYEARQLKVNFDMLAIASLFHDVGKIRIRDSILKKPAALNDWEMDEIRMHPIYSEELLRGKYSDNIAYVARCHHERQNGSGYPDGLTADMIPIEAQIIAVADSFDAMTNKRPYKAAKTPEAAIAELRGMSAVYNTEAVEALARLYERGELD